MSAARDLPSASLVITVTSCGEDVVVSLAGELDLATSPSLEQRVRVAQDANPRRLIIDLGSLTFIDGRGLRLLLIAGEDARRSGCQLLLRPGPRHVQRLFELTGTTALFTFEDASGQAHSQVPPGEGRAPRAARPPGLPDDWEDPAMDDQTQRRLARNEALLREVNDGIVRGLWPGEQRARFRCECARLDCNETIELSLAEYERLRGSPRRFAVIAGHELPELETVVEAHSGYLTVEKGDLAGAIVESADPRG